MHGNKILVVFSMLIKLCYIAWLWMVQFNLDLYVNIFDFQPDAEGILIATGKAKSIALQDGLDEPASYPLVLVDLKR